jgi:hypothetical protein
MADGAHVIWLAISQDNVKQSSLGKWSGVIKVGDAAPQPFGDVDWDTYGKFTINVKGGKIAQEKVTVPKPPSGDKENNMDKFDLKAKAEETLQWVKDHPAITGIAGAAIAGGVGVFVWLKKRR